MSMTNEESQVTTHPLEIAQVVRDGGGTAQVELTVAAKLRDRGHQVTVYGPPEVREPASAAGFALNPLVWPSPGPPPDRPLVARMAGAAAAWARALAPRLARADLLVADCMAYGALMAARLARVPSAGVMPTVYVGRSLGPRAGAMSGDWDAVVSGVNHARSVLGLRPVVSLTGQLLDADRLLVLTARAFELPDVRPPAHVRYVGPQLPLPTRHPVSYARSDDGVPLVLVSLSTTDQGQLGLLRRLLAAFAELPVNALVTVGPAVDMALLDPPPNVVLERYVPHAAVLPHADLVVTHAGHGTVLAAVAAGVPLVCVPMSRDQPAVAARVTAHGLGIRVEPDAGVADLRAAVRTVLDDPAYRGAARRMAPLIEPPDRVVAEIEALAAARTNNVGPTGR